MSQKKKMNNQNKKQTQAFIWDARGRELVLTRGVFAICHCPPPAPQGRWMDEMRSSSGDWSRTSVNLMLIMFIIYVYTPSSLKYDYDPTFLGEPFWRVPLACCGIFPPSRATATISQHPLQSVAVEIDAADCYVSGWLPIKPASGGWYDAYCNGAQHSAGFLGAWTVSCHWVSHTSCSSVILDLTCFTPCFHSLQCLSPHHTKSHCI